jgi:hypothetical protein
MTTLYATFDGEVLRPEGPLPLQPGTRVRITIHQSADSSDGPPYSFIEAALAMDLQGPPDWSERVDDYLYGGMGKAGEGVPRSVRR